MLRALLIFPSELQSIYVLVAGRSILRHNTANIGDIHFYRCFRTPERSPTESSASGSDFYLRIYHGLYSERSTQIYIDREILPIRFPSVGFLSFHDSILKPRNIDMKMMKSSIVIFLALMSLAPVLRTLTAATSSDSIWALSAILFVLNLLLADYVPRDGLAKTR